MKVNKKGREKKKKGREQRQALDDVRYSQAAQLGDRLGPAFVPAGAANNTADEGGERLARNLNRKKKGRLAAERCGN